MNSSVINGSMNINRDIHATSEDYVNKHGDRVKQLTHVKLLYNQCILVTRYPCRSCYVVDTTILHISHQENYAVLRNG